MHIRVLPGNIANMIAAGEVVQRPSSVVKELMENAVDAGAQSVSVIIKDAGRTLIQVIDNGCGMSGEEALLCFERHATSKIASAEDLQRITTFGFRGEALASIAAVARVTLRTRREDDEVGVKVEIESSNVTSKEPVSTPKGSNFEVKDLFYSVPARRKFLKSDNAEFRHIVEEFTRVALTRPEVAFTLVHNDKNVYSLKKAQSLKFRIQDLMGKATADGIVPLETATPLVKISGYIGSPATGTKTIANQFFFVNGRYFRSPYLHKAVMKAYEEMLPQGTTPAYFIYMDVDPSSMDVNISPTKTEIKFEDDSVIFQVLYACTREALGTNSFGATIDFTAGDTPELPVFGKGYSDFRPDVGVPQVTVDPTYNPFDSLPGEGGSSKGVPTVGSSQTDYSKFVDRHENYGALFEERTIPASKVLILGGKYVASPVASGILLVSIARARERIFYERFLKAMSASGHVSQTALFPVEIIVGVAPRLVFEEHLQELRTLGFDIALSGNDAITVNGVPDGFSTEPKKVEALMADVLIALSDESTPLPGMIEAATAQKFASIASKGGKAPSSPQEAQRLIDTLFGCENSEYTPRGHKTMTIISFDEIDQKF